MKHKGLIIAVIALVVVALGCGAAYAFAGDSITNTVMLKTKSDREYYEWLTARQIKRGTARLRLDENFDRLRNEQAETESLEAADLSLKLSVTDEFCDKFNLYSFKDEELRLSFSMKDGSLAYALTPVYGGIDLITLKALLDMDNMKMYAQVPTYRDEVIDLSFVFDMDMGDGRSIGTYLEEVWKERGDITARQNASADDTSKAELYNRYMTFLAESDGEVSLKKNQTVSLGDTEIKVTKMTVTYDAQQLKDLIGGLCDLLREDGYLDASMDKDSVAQVLSAIPPNASAYVTFDLDGKGNPVSEEIGIKVNSTEVEFELSSTDEDGTKVSTMDVKVNGLKLVGVTLRGSSSSGEYDYTLSVELGKLIKAALGDAGQMSFAAGVKGNKDRCDITVGLLDSGSSLAEAGLSIERKEYEPVLDVAGKTVYSADEILDSDYFDPSALVGLGLDILDSVNEEFVNAYVDKLLNENFGEGMSIEAVREMYEAGLIDRLFGIIDPEEASAPTAIEELIPGVVSIPVDEYTPTQWKYPEPGDVYYFSKPQLAKYCDPGDYRNISYNVTPDDITPEAFEEEKRAFLESYRDYYYESETPAAAALGDEIVFTVAPVMGNAVIEAYTYSDCYAVLGQYEYGEGVDDEIVGMGVGDQKDVFLTLGEQYGDFAGYSGTFRVTLDGIYRYIEPEWTEDFICGTLGYSSLDECSDFLMSNMMTTAEDIYWAVSELAKDSAKYRKYPEDVVNELKRDYYYRLYDITWDQGLTPEEYFDTYMGTDVEGLAEIINADVLSTIDDDAFFAAVAEKEGIYLTGEEVAELVESSMSYYSSFEEMMSYYPLDEIVDEEIMYRIYDIIYDNADVTYR